MHFTVLGSGTAVPDPERGPAGFLVQAAGKSWLVDGGTGTLQRCARAGVDPRRLDGGIYSHHHPDHCADLVPLLFAMHVGPPPRDTDYPIWAGKGMQQLYDRLTAAWGRWTKPGKGEVRITEIPLDGEQVHDLGGLVLRTRPAVHSAGALHLRFEADGASVVFSGDTAASEELVTLAQGCDLLVCECAGSDEEPALGGHMTPSDIADLVRRAKPREVWLTHFYPQVGEDLALKTVGAAGVPVRHARDLDRWEGPR